MKRLLIFLLVASVSSTLFADVRLPMIFGDNMVLQRNQPIPVWGWASAGEKIIVRFNKQTAATKAGKDGKWKVELKNETAGGPYTLSVTGKNQLSVNNVLVGEVWVCSGQSNMEMYVRHSSDGRYEKEIHEDKFPEIRHFKVKKAISDTMASDVTGGDWKTATDSVNIADFSSVGYFFAKKLYQELKVPIGLINSSWGGTVVETWISRQALDSSEAFRGAVTKKFNEVQTKSDDGFLPNNYPSLLFNAMINPLIPYGIKGVLWYQGESNAYRASQYNTAFSLMINDWRARWKEGNFPFYFVQLASWMANNGTSNKGSSWAEPREAQTKTLSLPNTGMAVTLDIGDTKDIHPADKKDVGERLAAIALNKQYGKQSEYSGPIYGSMNTDGSKVTISFTHAGNGLRVSDKYGYLKGFEVAGADQQFHYAKADIKDGKVVVYSDSVSAPVAVRYGWADDMPEADLYNKEGFPAAPFRTDDWKMITEGEKYTIK